MDEQYITPHKVKKKFGVTASTIRGWAKSGKIKYRKTPTGRWLYSLKSIEEATEASKDTGKEGKKYIYCRVSSAKQRDDLNRQIAFLQEHYPNRETISDIGSGINWRRAGFNRLLEGIVNGTIAEIVVTRKDRLVRFSYDIIKKICDIKNVRLVVHYEDSTTTEEEKLAEDLLSIVNVFVARNNGRRSHKNVTNNNTTQIEKDEEYKEYKNNKNNKTKKVNKHKDDQTKKDNKNNEYEDNKTKKINTKTTKSTTNTKRTKRTQRK